MGRDGNNDDGPRPVRTKRCSRTHGLATGHPIPSHLPMYGYPGLDRRGRYSWSPWLGPKEGQARTDRTFPAEQVRSGKPTQRPHWRGVPGRRLSRASDTERNAKPGRFNVLVLLLPSFPPSPLEPSPVQGSLPLSSILIPPRDLVCMYLLTYVLYICTPRVGHFE